MEDAKLDEDYSSLPALSVARAHDGGRQHSRLVPFVLEEGGGLGTMP